MSKGISLHIGISKVSNKSYRTEGLLRSPANDARAMADIARHEGYGPVRLLVDEAATRQNFMDGLTDCIRLLEPGDTFLLSFSGHGGQAEDVDGDENNEQDETWCFYDGPMVDDEIGRRWQEFKPDVNIVVISASCHSRTGLKPFPPFSRGSFQPRRPKKTPVKRNVLGHYAPDVRIGASILHLSACEDHRQARDGTQYSRFTELLLDCWDDGHFTGTYEDMARCINREAGYLQQSSVMLLGKPSPALLGARPFGIINPKK